MSHDLAADNSLRRRVGKLEQDMERVLTMSRAQRTPRYMAPQWNRFAITIKDGTYPTWPQNCFKIAFADVSYTAAEGTQSLTVASRAATSPVFQAYARTLHGLWLPEGTLCAVQDTPSYPGTGEGHWIILGPEPTLRYGGLLQGALASGDASKTVDNLEPLGGPGGLTSVTAYNVHGWEGDDNAECRVEWNTTTGHWELYQVTCPA